MKKYTPEGSGWPENVQFKKEPQEDDFLEPTKESLSIGEFLDLPKVKILDEDQDGLEITFGEERVRVHFSEETMFRGQTIYLDRQTPRDIREAVLFHELREKEYGSAGFEDAHERAVNDELMYALKYYNKESVAKLVSYGHMKRVEAKNYAAEKEKYEQEVLRLARNFKGTIEPFISALISNGIIEYVGKSAVFVDPKTYYAVGGSDVPSWAYSRQSYKERKGGFKVDIDTHIKSDDKEVIKHRDKSDILYVRKGGIEKVDLEIRVVIRTENNDILAKKIRALNDIGTTNNLNEINGSLNFLKGEGAGGVEIRIPSVISKDLQAVVTLLKAVIAALELDTSKK